MQSTLGEGELHRQCRQVEHPGFDLADLFGLEFGGEPRDLPLQSLGVSLVEVFPRRTFLEMRDRLELHAHDEVLGIHRIHFVVEPGRE